MVVRPWSKRFLAAALVCTLGLIANGGPAANAYAGTITCRSDPTVHLSNGRTVVLYADIEDALADIQAVNYTLHVPMGVTAVSVVGDDSGIPETVTVVADLVGNQGRSDTVVTTGTPAVPVTAYAAAEGHRTASVHGVSNETIVVVFKAPRK